MPLCSPKISFLWLWREGSDRTWSLEWGPGQLQSPSDLAVDLLPRRLVPGNLWPNRPHNPTHLSAALVPDSSSHPTELALPLRSAPGCSSAGWGPLLPALRPPVLVLEMPGLRPIYASPPRPPVDPSCEVPPAWRWLRRDLSTSDPHPEFHASVYLTVHPTPWRDDLLHLKVKIT